MSKESTESATTGSEYFKETLVDGAVKRIRCLDIDGQVYRISGWPVTVVQLEDDWYEDVEDPERTIHTLTNTSTARADLFSFWQRPLTHWPKHPYYRNTESIAILPISTYEEWFKNQINSKTRNMIRKSQKRGVTTTMSSFDDGFVEGMTSIFNESPIRQGRSFWHYGKDKETVRRHFSRYLSRELLIRADLEGEMVGLVMLGDAGDFAIVGQVISSLRHRDKAVNNALVAKSVEICAEKGWNSLCYYYWGDDSLTAFKRSCGFQKIEAPRYYVPLTNLGRFALKFGAHRGLRNMVPTNVKSHLKKLRNSWYSFRNQ